METPTRYVLTAVFGLVLSLGASSNAEAGFWGDVKEGFKSGARDVKENTKAVRDDVRTKSKEGWKEVKEGTKGAVTDTKDGLKKAWSKVKE
jgi:hypothetical protein